MSRTIAIGDVHGQWEKLLRLLETIGYENTDDILIFLGDYADARKQGIDNHNAFKTWSVIDSITNKICLLGNHDIWARDYLNNKMHEDDEQWWLDNGGIYTVREFQKLDKVFQLPHLKAFYSSLVKYHETDTFVCVHGGFPIKQKWIWPSIPEDICCWSRTIPECIGKGQVFDNLPKIVGVK
jgi:serine/threonine protein phosphatase 1